MLLRACRRGTHRGGGRKESEEGEEEESSQCRDRGGGSRRSAGSSSGGRGGQAYRYMCLCAVRMPPSCHAPPSAVLTPDCASAVHCSGQHQDQASGTNSHVGGLDGFSIHLWHVPVPNVLPAQLFFPFVPYLYALTFLIHANITMQHACVCLPILPPAERDQTSVPRASKLGLARHGCAVGVGTGGHQHSEMPYMHCPFLPISLQHLSPAHDYALIVSCKSAAMYSLGRTMSKSLTWSSSVC